MAVQAVGGVTATGTVAPIGINATERAGAGAGVGGARNAQAGAQNGQSTSDSSLVISRVTRTKDDGSTVTTITYADGHTETETTPPKFTANENQPAAQQNQGAQAGESLNGGDQQAQGVKAGESLNAGGQTQTQGVQAGGSLNTGANQTGANQAEGRITGVDILA
jgi:hypothetical protein